MARWISHSDGVMHTGEVMVKRKRKRPTRQRREVSVEEEVKKA